MDAVADGRRVAVVAGQARVVAVITSVSFLGSTPALPATANASDSAATCVWKTKFLNNLIA